MKTKVISFSVGLLLVQQLVLRYLKKTLEVESCFFGYR